MGQTNVHDYYLVTDPVEYSDEAGVFSVGEIPAETLVLESRLIVLTAFTGTSVAIDLGDEDDDDCFVGQEEAATPETIGMYVGDGDPSDTYQGAWYPAAKRVTITLAGTQITTGKAVGILHCLDLSYL